MLTPASWCILWMVNNPLARISNNREVKLQDVEQFIYFLKNGVTSDPIEEQLKRSEGILENEDIQPEEAVEIIRKAVKDAFSPLKMFPATKSETQLVGENETIYDADWMTGLCAKVSEISGLDADFIMRNSSLTFCHYYYIQWCRSKGVKGIERLTDEEILEAMAKRTCEMIASYFVEKEVLKPEEKDDFLKIISTPPET